MRTRRLSRRLFLAQFGGTVALVGLATACATAPITPPTASGESRVPATTAPAQPKTGGAMVVGLTRSISNTVPYPGSQFIFGWAVFDSLVSVDPGTQPIPGLAESWKLAEDRSSITLDLRAGVTFHSGRVFNAEDAKWNIEYAQDPRNQAAAGAELKSVEARVVDARTLELRLSTPMPHLFSLLAGVMMIDPQSDLIQHAVGTGPFKLDGFTPGDEMRLVRNPRYWRPDRPRLDVLTIRTMRDANAGVVALESGAADLVQCPLGDVKRLNAGADTQVIVLPGSGSYDFVISAVDPPFTDRRVRQAIDLTLDRKRFAETIMYGLTDPAYSIWLRQSPVWDAAADSGEFNVSRARELLSSAGYPNGFDTLIQASSAYPELVQFDEIVQADLAKIGIRASIEVLGASQALTLVTQAKFAGLINHAYSYGDQDPAMQFTAFVLRPEGNASRFTSDEYVQLVTRARREPDWNKRKSIYRDIAVFLKNEAFLLPIANSVNPWGMRSNVHGVVRQPLVGEPSLAELWLS
jgi:peptide/nickel transport system substrate-binding protein